MIPLGYMYKSVGPLIRTDLPDNVVDFHTLGQCPGNSTEDFADYINFWKHNSYWLFNSPQTIQEVAAANDIALTAMTCFYYEANELEFDFADDADLKVTQTGSIISPEDTGRWTTWRGDDGFETNIQLPVKKLLSGYDVVEYCMGTSHECSLIACSDLLHKWKLNSHGLFATFDGAKSAVETGLFHDHEPGPYRIIAVYTLD